LSVFLSRSPPSRTENVSRAGAVPPVGRESPAAATPPPATARVPNAGPTAPAVAPRPRGKSPHRPGRRPGASPERETAGSGTETTRPAPSDETRAVTRVTARRDPFAREPTREGRELTRRALRDPTDPEEPSRRESRREAASAADRGTRVIPTTGGERWNGESSPVQVRAVDGSPEGGADAQPNAGPNRRGLTPLCQPPRPAAATRTSHASDPYSLATRLPRKPPRALPVPPAVDRAGHRRRSGRRRRHEWAQV